MKPGITLIEKRKMRSEEESDEKVVRTFLICTVTWVGLLASLLLYSNFMG